MTKQTTLPPPSLAQLRLHRAEILALAENYGAFNVRVIGSIARKTATAASDVDFVVEFHDWASLYDQSGLKQDLEQLLGYPVDVLSDHPKMKPRLREKIMRDAVLLDSLPE